MQRWRFAKPIGAAFRKRFRSALGLRAGFMAFVILSGTGTGRQIPHGKQRGGIAPHDGAEKAAGDHVAHEVVIHADQHLARTWSLEAQTGA